MAITQNTQALGTNRYLIKQMSLANKSFLWWVLIDKDANELAWYSLSKKDVEEKLKELLNGTGK